MLVIMTLKSLEVVSETTRLTGCWSPINQGITTNFERSGEVSWAETF